MVLHITTKGNNGKQHWHSTFHVCGVKVDLIVCADSSLFVELSNCHVHLLLEHVVDLTLSTIKATLGKHLAHLADTQVDSRVLAKHSLDLGRGRLIVTDHPETSLWKTGPPFGAIFEGDNDPDFLGTFVCSLSNEAMVVLVITANHLHQITRSSLCPLFL